MIVLLPELKDRVIFMKNLIPLINLARIAACALFIAMCILPITSYTQAQAQAQTQAAKEPLS